MKTSDLTGLALDWAVATANGDTFTLAHEDWDWYSSSWEYGGPIIERERIGIRDDGGDGWAADDCIHATMHGDTPLIAAMRCFVASRLGDDVDVPKEVA